MLSSYLLIYDKFFNSWPLLQVWYFLKYPVIGGFTIHKVCDNGQSGIAMKVGYCT